MRGEDRKRLAIALGTAVRGELDLHSIDSNLDP